MPNDLSTTITSLRLKSFDDPLNGKSIPLEFVCPSSVTLSGQNTIQKRLIRAGEIIISEQLKPGQEVKYSSSNLNAKGLITAPNAEVIFSGVGCENQ